MRDIFAWNERGTFMAASSKLMIGEAERRFPVRIRIGVPPEGFGARLDALKAWLDDNCGADCWAMTPSGLRGVLNDAVAVYFRDATLAGGFVARWCRGYQAETVGRRFRRSAIRPRSSERCFALFIQAGSFSMSVWRSSPILRTLPRNLAPTKASR